MRILAILGVLALFIGYPIAIEAPCVKYHILLARVTAYSPYEKGESKINHKGQRITNNKGVAVPKGTLKDGTIIEIQEYGIRRSVDDRTPQRSVKKHEKIASHKGVDIDIVIDLRYSNIKTKKALYKKDLGYQEIKILTQ